MLQANLKCDKMGKFRKKKMWLFSNRFQSGKQFVCGSRVCKLLKVEKFGFSYLVFPSLVAAMPILGSAVGALKHY